MERLAKGWKYEEDLYRDTYIPGKIVNEKERARGWVVVGQMTGGLDIGRKILMAARVCRTKLYAQFYRGMIDKDKFFNLCQQETTRLENQGPAALHQQRDRAGPSSMPQAKFGLSCTPTDAVGSSEPHEAIAQNPSQYKACPGSRDKNREF